VNWIITYFSESMQQEILSMPAGFLARYLRYTDRMEVFGPDLGMPHTRAMGDGLFELRLKAAEGIARGGKKCSPTKNLSLVPSLAQM
jgi:phage-related protein